MGPYQHVMARPQVADGGDGVQMWKVAAIIMNKQRTDDKGWSFNLRAGGGAYSSQQKQGC
jgi:hypothetical protein